MSKRVVELFFPLLQCLIVLPLVQTLCVWRVHLEPNDRVAGSVLTTTWELSLLFGIVCAALSILRAGYATYFAHMATASQLFVGWFFLFDSALSVNASGDIAVSCLLVISCAIQMLHPPRKLKSYDDVGMLPYATEWRHNDDISREVLNMNPRRIATAYPDRRHPFVRQIHGRAQRAAQRIRTLNGRIRRSDGKGVTPAHPIAKPSAMFTIVDEEDMNIYFPENSAVNAHAAALVREAAHHREKNPDTLPGISESEDENIIMHDNLTHDGQLETGAHNENKVLDP